MYVCVCVKNFKNYKKLKEKERVQITLVLRESLYS